MINVISSLKNNLTLHLMTVGSGLYWVMWILLIAVSYGGWSASGETISPVWIYHQAQQGLIGYILALAYIYTISSRQRSFVIWIMFAISINIHSLASGLYSFYGNSAAAEKGYSLASWYYMAMASVGWVHAFTALGLFYIQRVKAHSADIARAAKLEADLHRSQLNHLQASLNPHFLFNALNTVSALIVLGENKKADEATIILGDLLRRSLALNDQPMIDLNEEIEISRLYLDMESLRYADRVNIEWDIHDACLTHKVPKFVLQPLLENVFKHSVRHSAKTVHIIIKAEPHSSSYFTLSLWNSLPERQPIQESPRIHTGLENVNQRLALVFRNPVDFNAGPQLHNGIAGFLASARLPTHQGVT